MLESSEGESLLASREGRCPATHVTAGFSFQCEREYGHGGAHNATLDDPEYDPNFTYVVSWWPKERVDV